MVDATHTVPGQPLPTSAADTILGGQGDDTLSGLRGNDTLYGGSGLDNLYGGDGDDILQISAADGKFDGLNGGPGGDTLQLLGSRVISLAGFNASIASIETLLGNGRTLNGTSAPDVLDFSGLTTMTNVLRIEGLSGNDTLIGSVGDDDLRGGAHNDRLDGREGNDVLRGGEGSDTIVFADGYGADTVVGYQARRDFFFFAGVTGVRDFDDLTLTQVNRKTVLIDFDGIQGGDTLTIQKTTIAVLTANQADFIFS